MHCIRIKTSRSPRILLTSERWIGSAYMSQREVRFYATVADFLEWLTSVIHKGILDSMEKKSLQPIWGMKDRPLFDVWSSAENWMELTSGDSLRPNGTVGISAMRYQAGKVIIDNMMESCISACPLMSPLTVTDQSREIMFSTTASFPPLLLPPSKNHDQIYSYWKFAYVTTPVRRFLYWVTLDLSWVKLGQCVKCQHKNDLKL